MGAKTYLVLFAGVFALSTSAIFVRLAEAPSSTVAFYRLLIAALALSPALLLGRAHRREVARIGGAQWRLIVLAGALLALHYVLWFESLRLTSVASSTVIVCLQPVFSLAFDRFVSKREVPASSVVGCAIALVGCAVIGAGDYRLSVESFFGDVLAFVAAGVIALYFFVGERARRDTSALAYSTLGYFVSALVLLAFIVLRGDPLAGFPEGTWLAFLGIALISTIGGQFVFNLLLKRLPASAVTMGILGEPVGTCILAWIVLGEGMTLQQLAGMALIMAGMAVFFALPRRRALRADAS